MKSVILKIAFVYACPKCKKLNWILPTATPTSEEEYRKLNDLEPWQDLPQDWDRQSIVAPEKVKCKHCSEKFEVRGS